MGDANLSHAFLIHADFCGDVPTSPAVLPHANLRETNLAYANLSGVYLREADLRGAHLMGANLSGADLSQADLSNTTLSHSVMGKSFIAKDFHVGQTKLIGANLSGADLFGATFIGADLERANLSNAKLGASIFADIDLEVVKGLDIISHISPSTIGLDTIYRSRGGIPEVFLRGCGVPDEIVELSRSLSGKSNLYYRCFISHSTKDKRFCERLYADLQANGVRVWYFPEDAKWGEPVWGEIDRSIMTYDKLIVVCSENSLTSGPVLREIERALSREDKEGKNILFPVTLDGYIFDEWEHPRKADVLAKVVGTDFIGWSRSAAKYDAAFKKLLKALKAN